MFLSYDQTLGCPLNISGSLIINTLWAEVRCVGGQKTTTVYFQIGRSGVKITIILEEGLTNYLIWS